MTAVETVVRVLESKVLRSSLIYIPDRGATDLEIAALSKHLPRPLSDAHRALLQRWNGINLDVIRVYAASAQTELRSLRDTQAGPFADVKGALVFGDDPSGFVYAEALTGQVICFDSSSGDIKIIAAGLDALFAKLVFGEDAATFGGDEWVEELKRAGLI